MVQGSFGNVCPSVRLSVPAKKWRNFCTGWRIGPKFSGAPTLLASNFLAGESDPEAHGVRPGPRKMGFLPNLSPPRVLKQGGCVIPFRNRDNKAQKMLGAEFRILAHGRRKMGRKAGPAGVGWLVVGERCGAFSHSKMHFYLILLKNKSKRSMWSHNT